SGTEDSALTVLVCPANHVLLSRRWTLGFEQHFGPRPHLNGLIHFVPRCLPVFRKALHHRMILIYFDRAESLKGIMNSGDFAQESSPIVRYFETMNGAMNGYSRLASECKFQNFFYGWINIVKAHVVDNHVKAFTKIRKLKCLRAPLDLPLHTGEFTDLAGQKRRQVFEIVIWTSGYV